MVNLAKSRSFAPHLFSFDSWYTSLDNLKLVRDCYWTWLTRLKHNRQVSLAPRQSLTVDALDIGSKVVLSICLIAAT